MSTLGPGVKSSARSSRTAIGWLAGYDRATLRRDLVAGTTLAAYLVPASIGDASLAGLPPQAGLYSCLFSGLVFWIFCSSRHTVISVTSAISLLIGSTLNSFAAGDPARFSALASLTAVLVAVIGVIAWLVKAGAIARFISEGVMVGFKCGVALQLASTQLPKLLGFHGAHGDFWENSRHFLGHLGETNTYSFFVGLAALTTILCGKVWLKHKPVALFVVAGGIIASKLWALDSHGVALLGPVPQGLPTLSWPIWDWAVINDLLPLALACFLLGAVETAAIGRMFSAKHGFRLDTNQEFLAMAAANFTAGLGRGLPVSGGMSQSLVNESGGARTPLSGAIAAGFILLVLLFLTQLLQALPQPVLAAIVLAAVTGLFNLTALRHFWREDRNEFIVAITALLAVLGSGLLRGVLIGAIISLVQLIYRTSRPHVALLGRIPGTQRYSDIERHPDNESVPGVIVVRPEAALVYFNIDHVRDLISAYAKGADPQPELVMLDLSASPYVDLQSAHALAELADELAVEGIRLQVVDARSNVRDRLRHEGVDGKLGGVGRFNAVHDIIVDYQKAVASGKG